MLLDAKDRAILLHLESDARIPISHLAKKVRLSKDGVAYRIRNMERRGLIRGFYAVLNAPKLGFVPHKVMVKFQDASREKEEETAYYLKSNGKVEWIASCDGRWDFMFIFWGRSTHEFNRFYVKLLEKYGQFIGDRGLNIITESHSCKRKYIASTNPEESVSSEAPSVGGLDETDLEIIRLMAGNARIRTLELSKEVGMAPDSIAKRVRSLVEREVMQRFRPMLDVGVLGCQSYDVMIRLNTGGKLKKIFDFFKHHPNVIHYSRYSGSFDVGLTVEIENSAKFRGITREMKEKFPKEIRSYESSLVYKEHKTVFSPLG
ncbi:MAG: Lrp/AsnC family transcriptional regulator [Candidatus Micrarchaeota archaeon]